MEMGTRKGLVMWAMCLGLFLAQTDTTAVNLALPAIGAGLHGGLAGEQWVVDGYNLAFAALLLSGGTPGDRLGRRRLFLVGIAGFVAGSLCCAVATVLPVLIAGRVVQGAGAAMAIPQSLAILSVVFPGHAERHRAMAAWSTVTGIALATGPTLGGLLVDRLGWQYIFWLNLPIGAAAFALAAVAVPESRDPHARPFDWAGLTLVTGLLGSATFAVVEGRRLGWTSAALVCVVAGAVVCLAGFVLVERRQADPMLPLGLLRRGDLPAASVVALCMTFGMYGLFMLASLDFQQQRGTSALVAGLELLPLPVVITVGSPLTGRFVTRYGPRPAMVAGMAFMGLGLLGFAVLGGDAALLPIEVIFAMIGLGLALNTGPVVGAAVAAVSPDRAGLASGIVNLARMLGSTLGVAVAGTVLATVGGSRHFLHGLTAALMVGAAVELAGSVVALVAVRGRSSEPVPDMARAPVSGGLDQGSAALR
jgi:EmrB/QacA subfamily drug resistance transporter